MISDLAKFFSFFFRAAWNLLQIKTPFGNFTYAEIFIIGPLVVILSIAIFKSFGGFNFDKVSSNNAFKRGDKK